MYSFHCQVSAEGLTQRDRKMSIDVTPGLSVWCINIYIIHIDRYWYVMCVYIHVFDTLAFITREGNVGKCETWVHGLPITSTKISVFGWVKGHLKSIDVQCAFKQESQLLLSFELKADDGCYQWIISCFPPPPHFSWFHCVFLSAVVMGRQVSIELWSKLLHTGEVRPFVSARVEYMLWEQIVIAYRYIYFFVVLIKLSQVFLLTFMKLWSTLWYHHHIEVR